MSGVGGNDISSSSTSSRVAEPHHNRHRRPKTRGGNRPTAQREEAAAGSGRSVYYQTAQPYNSGQEQWYPTQGQSEANFAPTEETYGRPPSWLLELAGQVPDQSSNMLPYQGAGMLNPNARPFVPRQNQRRPPPPQYRHEAPSTRRAPVPTENSTTENLRDRLTEQLERETYECMICCQAIFANHWLWSCSQCFHMFHFHRQTDKSCITRWAHKSYDEETGWRCPSCQQANRDLPKEYRCFCGKEVQPRTRRGEDIPHSCGQTCHKERGFGCPHKCSLPCHPGPCPQCPRTVVRHCLCGDEEKSVRCGSNQEIRCSKVCDKLLNCGLHKCTGVCHAGGCEVCQETIVQKCHCGSAEREVACTALNLKENGYSCGRPCAGMFACGQHACENKCHPGDCGPCPLSPERLVRCPCGRTEITALLSAPRQFCSDQVPVCNNVCDKVLGCGSQAKPHRCKAKCHNGPCPPCPDNSSLRCRCQALTKTLPCSELAEYTEDNPLLCERRCKKQKSCKQHKCQERCCIDVDHLCLQVCNRKLDCGTHLCDRLCHVGQCPRCLQASFEEQRCLCGVTVREPPIPCGASLPPCSEPCAREHSCDHPVMHNCHSEVDCPLCTALTRKWCYGKHEMRSNIPCYLKDVSCGKPCEKNLSCGVHRCPRICHPGECIAEGEECRQPCSVMREACGHSCGLPCHGKTDCPQSSCASQVQVSCGCGRKSAKMCCSEVDKTNAKAQAARAIDAKASNGSVVILERQDSADRYKCLPCDSECSRAQRNRKLAMALELDRDDDNACPTPGEPTYTDFLRTQAKTNPPLVLDVENALIQLVQSTESQRTNTTRNHVFRPMVADMRRLIHEYAAYFRVETLSYDPEPQRNVVASAKRGQSFVPNTLLSSFIPKTVPKIAPPPQKSAWGTTSETKEKFASSAIPAEGMQTLTSATTVVRRLPPVD